jgi:geranylgeranyl diphosphate synthase type I
MLIALALKYATTSQTALLRDLIGNPRIDEDAAARIREALITTGARDIVERMIRSRCTAAQRALEHAMFPPHAANTLHDLAQSVAVREK